MYHTGIVYIKLHKLIFYAKIVNIWMCLFTWQCAIHNLYSATKANGEKYLEEKKENDFIK